MSQTTEPRPIQRRLNIVLFGESGAGKSSVVNLILGLDHDVAMTSASSRACKSDTRAYDVAIRGHNFRVFETVGLNEPDAFRDSDFLIDGINKAYRLVKYLSDTGGVNLLVFCIRSGRITVGMQNNYTLFNDILCHKQVPVALVITHLEHEENMEDWWSYNHPHFTEFGIHVAGHACITARREFTDRYQVSRQAVHDLLTTHGCGVGFPQERVSWVSETFPKLLNLAGLRPRSNSNKLSARKLREYGLQEDEIAAIQTKFGALDKGMTFTRPLPRRLSVLPLLGRRRTLPLDMETKAPMISAAGVVDEPGNTSSTVIANPPNQVPLYGEMLDLVHERRFPNDLTGQVTREDHDPVACGGFADIYKGRLQLNTNSIRVAIKAIRPYSCEDDFTKKEKRLRREIRVWLNLKHDNVLPLLGTTLGFSRFPAMVCPWAENGTLTSYLKDRHTDLTVVEILRLLDNVASGLQYLHSHSVVHGDLSGSNILINESGSAWITDFGLSTLLTELRGLTFATSFHARGTTRWMAPELLDPGVSENEPEEAAPCISPMTYSDVYSFGGIMLQILDGKMPYYYYANDLRVALAVLNRETPTRPDNVLVTDRRWSFIQRCWSTLDITRSRPTCDEIVDFTRSELACIAAS